MATSRMFARFPQAIEHAIYDLKHYGQTVDSGHWQGVPTEGKPDLITEEIINLTFAVNMPATIEEAQEQIQPNLPWAEDHFLERVSREPLNPGEQYKNWPWWRGQIPQAMTAGDIFTHTYMERFWPKTAGYDEVPAGGRNWDEGEYNMGIRYEWGDLDSVVNLLKREPLTRQATFPIFFPEDTGAVHGGRVPCTLHYHFLRRHDLLHCWYAIRSCDAVRHFRDDLYLATRLVQWVINETDWEYVKPGRLYFTAYSFHVHKGDIHLL